MDFIDTDWLTDNNVMSLKERQQKEILDLFYGMSESMQKAVLDIMKATQVEKDV